MKRMYLVLIAVVMAVGFSAFTVESKPLETVYYNVGAGWQSMDNPCPPGETKFCKIDIGQHEDVQLYESINGAPVKYDEAR